MLDALKIPKADVMGYSLGSFIAQALTINYPEKVNSLILVASTCGGKDGLGVPQLQFDIFNKTLNNISITAEEIKSLNSASLGSGWIKLHPESLDIPENMTFQQLRPGLTQETMNNQGNVAFAWEDTNWSGACDAEAKLAKPTLVIKIPGAWLVQIKDAGHAVMNQYPDEIGKVLNTFLSATGQSS